MYHFWQVFSAYIDSRSLTETLHFVEFSSPPIRYVRTRSSHWYTTTAIESWSEREIDRSLRGSLHLCLITNKSQETRTSWLPEWKKKEGRFGDLCRIRIPPSFWTGAGTARLIINTRNRRICTGLRSGKKISLLRRLRQALTVKYRAATLGHGRGPPQLRIGELTRQMSVRIVRTVDSNR